MLTRFRACRGAHARWLLAGSRQARSRHDGTTAASPAARDGAQPCTAAMQEQSRQDALHPSARPGAPVAYAALLQRRRDEALQQQRRARQRQINTARMAHALSASSTPPLALEQQANGSSGHAPPGPSEKQAYQVVPAQADTVLLLPAVQPGAASNGAAPESSDAPAQRHHAHRRRRGGAGGRAQDARQAAGGSAGAQQQQAEQEQQAEDLDVSMGRAGADEGSGEDEDEHPRHFWSRQLQQPEWMTAVPPDLASQWLVMPRPQGPRVVVATGRSRTTVRSRGGSVLVTGWSALPDGSPHTYAGGRGTCILDCVWHEPNSTLYVLDLLVWRGYELYDCTAEFRAFWIQSKLSGDPELRAALLSSQAPWASRKLGASRTQCTTPASTPMLPDGGSANGAELESPMEAEDGQQQRDQPAAANGTPAGDGRQGGGAGMEEDAPSGASAGAAGGSSTAVSPSGRAPAGGGAAHGQRPKAQWLRVVPLLARPADAQGLQLAYEGRLLEEGAGDDTMADAAVGAPLGGGAAGAAGPAGGREFEQDGLYLLHKEGQYSQGALTPLALSWKDAGCSAWPVDTDPQGNALEFQVVTLVYRADATVATCDEPPVVLGTMPAAWVQAMGPKLLRPGRLLRFTLRQGGLLWAPDGRPAGADLRYEGPAHQRRGRADAFSKILFQQMARTAPLAWSSIR